jgi:hypothetical protein
MKLPPELLEPFTLTCAKCGGEAVAYPAPEPGAIYCPNCSPKWLKSYLEHATNRALGRVNQNVNPELFAG